MESEVEIDGKAFVHYKSWQETYAGLYAGLIDTEYLKRMTVQKCTAIAHKWTDDVLVAKDGEKVISFAGYGAYCGDLLPDHGEVYGIYVPSEYHGMKVAYKLMKAALEMLSEYKRIALWVLKGNDKAIRFYESYGFHFDETEKEILLGTPNTELRIFFERHA